MYDIFICSLDGRKLKIQINNNTTILEIKNKLYKFNNIIPERQKMIFCGRALGNNETMESIGVLLHTNIHIVYADEYQHWKKFRYKSSSNSHSNVKCIVNGIKMSQTKLNYFKKILKHTCTVFYTNTILKQHDLTGNSIPYSLENDEILYLTDQITSIFTYLRTNNSLYMNHYN
jgi:hypothetical protein